jgi:hypothetical protein
VRALRRGLVVGVGALLLLLLRPSPVTAQNVAARLDGRVSPAIAQAVQGIADDARARGLPVEPLVQKALEGGAKGVATDRVIAAVRVLAGRLDVARTALQESGIRAPSPDALESGADALNAGLNSQQVRDLGRVSRDPYDPAVTLRVAATLTALGVPAQQGLQLVQHMIHDRRGANELLDLPNEVREGMARGATAAEAAEGLDRGEGEGGQGGGQGGQGGRRGDRHPESDDHRPPRKP